MLTLLSDKELVVPTSPVPLPPLEGKPGFPGSSPFPRKEAGTPLDRERGTLREDPHTRAQGPAAKTDGVELKFMGCV